MKKRVISKKKGVAVLLSFLLGFSSLSLCIETRALADGDETDSQETETLKDDSIIFSGLLSEYTYTGEDITPEIKKSVSSESNRDVELVFYSGTSTSGEQVTPIEVGTYTLVASVPADDTYAAESFANSFQIVPATITESMIGSISEQPYTGSAIEPLPTVTFNKI